ncbi:MAG: hypothetical protein JNK15_24610 [Planctomycetes bacterium]|nr:hypothetical protein [Planctomycetota bacterium]
MLRARRATWPLRVVARGAEPPDGLDTTREQRIEMMWELTVQAWRLAGMPIPDYDRANTPVRLVRRNLRPLG